MPGIVHTKAHKALIATISSYLTEGAISQKVFAARCKRDEKWASALLNGHRGLQSGDLPRVAKAVGTTLQQFAKRWAAILSS